MESASTTLWYSSSLGKEILMWSLCSHKIKIILRGLEFILQGKDNGKRERGKEERRK